MRVCQFRHYGTVFYVPHRWPEHANRESLVFQTQPPLSIRLELLRSCGSSEFWAGTEVCRGDTMHETYAEK
jgi:hypothetical protein